MDGLPFIGQLMLYPGPGRRDLRGWMACNGRQLPIAGNELLATAIGVDVRADSGTFTIPDVPGPVPGAASYYIATEGIFPLPTNESLAGQTGGLASIELQPYIQATVPWTPCNGDPVTEENPDLLMWFGLMGLPAVLPDLPSPAPHLTYQICTYGTFELPA